MNILLRLIGLFADLCSIVGLFRSIHVDEKAKEKEE